MPRSLRRGRCPGYATEAGPHRRSAVATGRHSLLFITGAGGATRRPACDARVYTVAAQLPRERVLRVNEYVDEGAMIRPHAHERAEEILFLYEGHGTLTLEGRKIPVQEGSTCLVGRYVHHSLDNESCGPMKVLIVVFPPGIEEGWRAIASIRRKI